MSCQCCLKCFIGFFPCLLILVGFLADISCINFKFLNVSQEIDYYTFNEVEFNQNVVLSIHRSLRLSSPLFSLMFKFSEKFFITYFPFLISSCYTTSQTHFWKQKAESGHNSFSCCFSKTGHNFLAHIKHFFPTCVRSFSISPALIVDLHYSLHRLLISKDTLCLLMILIAKSFTLIPIINQLL